MKTESRAVSPADVYGSDPLARLVGRWRVKPIQVGLALALGGVLYLVLLSAIFGCLWPRDDLLRSSFEDRFNQVNFVLIFPAVAFYYVWQPAAIARVYCAVASFVRSLDGTIALPADHVRDWHSRRWWWLPGVLFALLGMGLGVLDNLEKVGTYWYAANWFMILVLQCARGVVLYALITITMRHLAASARLNRLFAQVVSIPLIIDPGRQSAYGIVNSYALSFAVIAAVAGLNLGLQPILSTPPMPEYVIFVAVYFVLAPLGFFLPLWQLHRNMRGSRQRALEELGRELQAAYERLLVSLRNDDRTGQQDALDRLNLIQGAVTLTSQSPSWPFQGNTLYRLIVAVVFPFVFTIIDVLGTLIDLAGGLVTR